MTELPVCQSAVKMNPQLDEMEEKIIGMASLCLNRHVYIASREMLGLIFDQRSLRFYRRPLQAKLPSAEGWNFSRCATCDTGIAAEAVGSPSTSIGITKDTRIPLCSDCWKTKDVLTDHNIMPCHLCSRFGFAVFGAGKDVVVHGSVHVTSKPTDYPDRFGNPNTAFHICSRCVAEKPFKRLKDALTVKLARNMAEFEDERAEIAKTLADAYKELKPLEDISKASPKNLDDARMVIPLISGKLERYVRIGEVCEMVRVAGEKRKREEELVAPGDGEKKGKPAEG